MVTNQDEEKLGKVAGLFVDDTSGVPTWVSVTSGLFGAHHYLLPLAETRFDGEVLWVPYSKDDLAAAPPHDPDVPLTIEEEQLLYDHYNVGYGTDDTTGPQREWTWTRPVSSPRRTAVRIRSMPTRSGSTARTTPAPV